MASVSTEKPSDSEPFLRTEPQTHKGDLPNGARGPNAPEAGPEPCSDVGEKLLMQMNRWARFGVLAVHIDPPRTGKSKALHQVLRGLLKAAETTHKAIWFPWNDTLYGCVVPEMDAASASTVARQLQDELARQVTETVSIGVSEFPLLDFDRSRSLTNACKALDHAAFFGPGSVVIFDAVSLNISGDQYYQAGEMDAAMTEYQAALRLDPHNVNVHNSLGVCLAKQDDPDGAQHSFQAALQIDPKETMAIYNLGLIQLLKQAPQKALENFKTAYALDRKTFDIPFQIGKLLTEQKQWRAAKPYLESAIALRNDHGPAYCLLGHCWSALDRASEALATYKKAVRLNPNDAAALSALGVLYDDKGENPDICITFCRQSVILAPENGLFRQRLGALYQKHDQLERALAEYEKAAALGCDCRSQVHKVRHQLGSKDQGSQRCA